MRKILFRGRDHAGKWHKGSLITRIEESPVPKTAAPYEVYYIKEQDFAGEEHEVNPETIGQLVFPATEEHPDIWKGDIIADKDGHRMVIIFSYYKHTFYAITQNKTRTAYRSLDGRHLYFNLKYGNVKVVGNIHDPLRLKQ